ncbi:hypothetical protein ACEQ8H_006209 [Pleosporales sp. CAS-2024a]
MASRGRSPAVRAADTGSRESSPDPLAMSFDENKARPAPRATPPTARVSTSPRKQNRRPAAAQCHVASPTKAMILNTPRMGTASPWRIKVTVQAEPGSDDETMHSPSVQHVTRTQTTTIPLKDGDASSPVKRGPGRPRKSDIASASASASTPKPKSKRAGTPIKRRARSKSRDSSAGPTDASGADVDTDAPPKRRRGRPRRKPQPPAQDEHVIMDMLQQDELPIVDTPPRTELGDRLRARRGTPHSKKIVVISSDEESAEDSDLLTPDSDEAHSSHPVEDDDEELQDATNFAFDQGTTRMPDDTTIMDSENFSIISVDSLPSRGNVTSPRKPKEHKNPTPRSASMLKHEYLQPLAENASTSESREAPQPSSAHVSLASTLAPHAGPTRPVMRRYVTPVIDSAIPSAPPQVAPAFMAPPKADTPRLGRVVTAGVALQGLMDPSRLTPEPSQKMLDEKPDRLDDLFRGFSEGTRKELQAGLRLGEQLAQGQEPGPSSHANSSPSKASSESGPASEGLVKTGRKSREPRLLTPEDQDDFVVSQQGVPAADNVEYPALDTATEKSLPSPARSENDMSWRVDTPPTATGNTERMHSITMAAPAGEPSQGTSDAPNIIQAINPTHQEDYADIWQEEASRSSNSAGSDNASQVQHLFGPGPAVPARGKLPRTWRRKSGNHFQYSDEAESPRQPDSAQANTEEAPEDQNNQGEDAASDATGDTGMFFQSNMPSIFNKRHSRELKKKKTEKLDLGLLLNEGASLVPESSPPPVLTKKSSPATKTNPFLNTPPRFSGFPSSPHKSSPLRQELRGSEISSEAQSGGLHEESSLPLPQSSPFHTYVDGESKVSVASDQRQLQMEMGDVTASSIRHVRNEADGYSEAYERQERSLNEIEEVTEYSRTAISRVVSSPLRIKVLSPVRKRVPLFPSPAKPVDTDDSGATPAKVVGSSTPMGQPEVATAQSQQDARQRPSSVLTRMTSSLWSTVSGQETVVKPHPILSKMTALPKIEPWTKTHYKTLDKLYALSQKHPALFEPSASPPTQLSQTNAHLLQKFLANNNKQAYLGAVFTAWGYEFDMTEDLVVLCQVFCELMTLDSIKAYESLKGKRIEMGDCMPGRTGDAIGAEQVVRRLATVILGDEVRADEKHGIEIDRSKPLEIRWPR